jgi:YD repeat-containing protein
MVHVVITYDAVGNMTNMARKNARLTINKPVSATNSTASYDSAGNMISQTLDGSVFQCAFGTENRYWIPPWLVMTLIERHHQLWAATEARPMACVVKVTGLKCGPGQ